MSNNRRQYTTQPTPIKPSPAVGQPCDLISELWSVRDLIDHIQINTNKGLVIGAKHVEASKAAPVRVLIMIEDMGQVALGQAILDHYGGFEAAEAGLKKLAKAINQAIHFPGQVPNQSQSLIATSSANQVLDLLTDCVHAVARFEK